MPLLTLKQVAQELGYTTVAPVLKLAAAGHLTILRLPSPAGAKRALGTPRVDAADLARMIGECAAAAESDDGRPLPGVDAADLARISRGRAVELDTGGPSPLVGRRPKRMSHGRSPVLIRHYE